MTELKIGYHTGTLTLSFHNPGIPVLILYKTVKHSMSENFAINPLKCKKPGFFNPG